MRFVAFALLVSLVASALPQAYGGPTVLITDQGTINGVPSRVFGPLVFNRDGTAVASIDDNVMTYSFGTGVWTTAVTKAQMLAITGWSLPVGTVPSLSAHGGVSASNFSFFSNMVGKLGVFRFSGGVLQSILKSDDTLDGVSVVKVGNVFSNEIGRDVYAVETPGNVQKIYTSTTPTGPKTLLLKSGDAMPGGGTFIRFDFTPAIDGTKKIYFSDKPNGAGYGIFVISTNGLGLASEVQAGQVLAPGFTAKNLKVIHAQDKVIYFDATSQENPKVGGLFKKENGVVEMLIGPGTKQYPNSARTVVSAKGLACSPDGVWRSAKVLLDNGQEQVWIHGPTLTGAKIWIGPTFGQIYTDAATGRPMRFTSTSSFSPTINNNGMFVMSNALFTWTDTLLFTFGIILFQPNYS